MATPTWLASDRLCVGCSDHDVGLWSILRITRTFSISFQPPPDLYRLYPRILCLQLNMQVTNNPHPKVRIIPAQKYVDVYSFQLMKVEIGRLAMSTSQRAAVDQIYSGNKELSLVFSEGSVSDQENAQLFLRSHGLNLETRSGLESRWNVQWSAGWGVGPGKDTRRRSLYQW